jgi:dipeptidyl aminopeptidase/acylaminoacyl peptidase
VLKRAALLAVVLVTAGCGSVEKAAGPQPDGRNSIERHLVYEKLIGKKGVWIADADGGHARLLVPDGRAPAVSPDGKWVVYMSCDPEDEWVCKGTFVVSTSGGKPRKLSSDVLSRPPPAGTWSPDSKRILVTRGSVDEEKTLVSIDIAGGKKLKIAEGISWGWSFSPDGKQIVYVRAGPPVHASGLKRTDLFVVDSAGGEPKQITHTGDSLAPAWGPKSIAFARLVPDGDWGRSEIWQVQPDGSGLKTITGPLPEPYRGDGGDASDGLIPVAWSEDGHALLSAWLEGTLAIPVAVDPEGGKIRELLEDDGNANAVALAHDGRMALAYTYPPIGGFDEDSATVLIVPYAGGKPKVVARGAGSPSWNR